MEVIKDEGLFFNALTRKNYFGKSAAGAGLAADGFVTAGTVKTAIGSAYVSKVVGGVTLPAWLPAVGGKVIFGKTITEFSFAAFLSGLNPVLITALGVGGIVLLIVALSKKHPLSDKDLTSIGDNMGKVVADFIFLPIIIEKGESNRNIFFRNMRETMVDDFGYTDEFTDSYIENAKTKSKSQLMDDLSHLYKEMKDNRAMKQIYRKFDAKKIRKYALKRMGY